MSEETELAGDCHNENEDGDGLPEKTKEEGSMGARVGLVFSMFLTSIFLVASLALIIFWVIWYGGKFTWADTDHPKLRQFPVKFDFHPTLMIGGFIFFSGFSMMFYRMMTCCRKLIVKLLHTIFHSLAIACIAIGFLTIWDCHEIAKIPHFYSLHAWLGLTTMGLFAIQFVVGFFSFLILLCCEGGTAACRASLVPTHSTFGIITFVMACATAVVGLTETAFFSMKETDTPGSHSMYRLDGDEAEAVIVNTLGVVIIAAMIIMVWLLRTNLGSKRGSSAVLSERL